MWGRSSTRTFLSGHAVISRKRGLKKTFWSEIYLPLLFSNFQLPTNLCLWSPRMPSFLTDRKPMRFNGFGKFGLLFASLFKVVFVCLQDLGWKGIHITYPLPLFHWHLWKARSNERPRHIHPKCDPRSSSLRHLSEYPFHHKPSTPLKSNKRTQWA